MVKTIGIVLKPHTKQALKAIEVLQNMAPSKSFIVEKEGYHALDIPNVEHVSASEFQSRCDLVVVLGGDGTLLHAASILPDRIIPILGINMGHIGFMTEVNIGFMTEVSYDELQKSFKLALSEKLEYTDRMRLDVIISESEKHSKHKRNNVFSKRILNDVVIGSKSLARIGYYKVFLGNELVTKIRGDGVIVSTPTGSTAYSMAAGGSILTPDIEAVLITPVCPHQLTQRPLILNPKETIYIEEDDSDDLTFITCDGQSGFELKKNYRVSIRLAPIPTRLLKIPWRSYFDMLRTKLQWGINFK